MKVLIVIDMQNDFITGALANSSAEAIIPNVVDKIIKHNGAIIYTQDTHYQDYLETQEGKHLPIPHCINDTWGAELCAELRCANNFLTRCNIVRKSTFGSLDLTEHLLYVEDWNNEDTIELVGICTGICVISNALLLKTLFPEVNIVVDASCCACVTPESHKQALAIMKLCHIDIINESEEI